MATQATSTGPIAIFQINHTYFVGDEGFNIQQTVNFAVADGNAGTVVIPQEYTGTDPISAVTGGSTTVYLMDERGGQRQAYLWVTNAYVAEPILPIGIGTPQINHQLFVGPLGKFPTIQSAITFANGGKYAIIIPQTYAGSEDIATLTGGAASVYISDQRTYQWQNYYWTGTQYAPIIFTPLGAVSFPSGITGPLTVNGVVTVTDSIATPMITADTADFTAIECETLDSSDTITGNAALFETCLVENSPVRTFANTGDPDTGMSFPPAGIGVSTGTAWDDDSIDPATLAIWPPVGVPVSTGTAWGFSIPANTIPRLNMANIFTGLNTFASVIVNQSFQATMNNGSNPPVVAPSAGGFALGWNSQPGNGETDFINSNGGAGGGFNWYNVGGGTNIGPTTTPSMFLDSANALHVTGNIGTGADAYVTGISHLANGNLRIGARTTAPPWNAGTPNINSNGLNLILNSSGGTGINFNWDQVGSTYFGNGAGIAVATVDQIGNASFNGHASITGDISTGVTIPGQGLVVGWNLASGTGETDFINARGGGAGGFAWYNAGGGTTVPPGASRSMWLDSGNNLNVASNVQTHGLYSYVQAGDTASVGSNTAGAAFTRLVAVVTGQTGVNFPGQFNLETISATTTSSVGDTLRITHTSLGPDGYSPPLWAINRGGVMYCAVNNLRIGPRSTPGWTTGSPNINSDGQNFYINAGTGSSLALNYDQGSAVLFFNGAGVSIAQIDVHGNAQFNGNLTAGSKSFRITHPLDETKDLMHGSLEGPEFGVYYRGEAVTKDGVATITLPDYFEALTRKEDRTIQLTELYDEAKEPMFGNFIAAGRIVNGKFNVRTSSKVAVKFYWEVKAVRADQPALKVTIEKEKAIVIPNPPATDAGTDRDRTPETRESKPKKVRS